MSALRHAAQVSPRLGQLLDAGMTVTAEAYDTAVAETATARARLDYFFGACDAVLVPAAPGEAPPGLGYTGDPVFNRMWTLLGTPCLTLPALWGASGLPTGIQLVGRIGDDARLMAAALFIERALAAHETSGYRLHPDRFVLARLQRDQPISDSARRARGESPGRCGAARRDLLQHAAQHARAGSRVGAGRVCAEHDRDAGRHRLVYAGLSVAAADARNFCLRTAEIETAALLGNL